jgi:hypothetical protein
MSISPAQSLLDMDQEPRALPLSPATPIAKRNERLGQRNDLSDLRPKTPSLAMEEGAIHSSSQWP